MSDNVSGMPNRGKTYLTGPNRTPDTSSTSTKAIAGLTKTFADLDYSNNPATIRSEGQVVCRLVRNSSGISLLPKMAVTWKSGARGKEVDGYADFSPDIDIAGIVDEWLPSTGVANNDYFWLVVKGPTLALTGCAADETNSIGMHAWLINLTGAASTFSTTSGRVGPAVLPTAGLTTNITFAMSNALHKLGRAMSAKTTSNTNVNILIDVDLY